MHWSMLHRLKWTPREFNVGDHVYLKVKSKKISLSLGRCSKLAPSYCGPYEVLAKIGLVAYQFTLPPKIKVHDVFHVSLLKYIYTWCYSYNWLGYDSGRTRGRVLDRTFPNSRQEGTYALESSHHSNKSAMETLHLWRGNLGNGG